MKAAPTEIGPAVPVPAGRFPGRRSRAAWVGAILLLATYAAITFGVAARKGLSFDEGEEMAVGYDIWRRHDFRMEGANGDFIKRWATLPFLVSNPTLPGVDQWYWRGGGAYELGYAFCFNVGNDVDDLLLQARSMTIVLGLATGLLVFCVSRSLFGDAGGLISLGLFTFSPHMLAFGAIVSTEMPICLALLGATWWAWRLLHRVTPGRLAASLASAGLLVLAKLTALAMLPIVAVMIAAKLGSSRPLEWAIGRPHPIRTRGRQAMVFAALLLAHAAVGWAAIWAHYEFRYTASPRPDDPTITTAVIPHPDPVSPLAAGFIRWSRRTRFLPEGFLNGVDRLLQHNDNRITFLDGRWKIGGWRRYFPRTLWLKTSPVLLLLLALAGVAWWRARGETETAPGAFPWWYEATPFLALVVVLLGLAMVQNLDIGHRHILPAYPALFVLAGAAGLARRRAGRKLFGIAMVLLAAIAAEAASAYPNYLAYFNPLAGGASQGYRHLVDSSVDWGMDLPELSSWLDRHNPRRHEPVYLAYFGTDNPTRRSIVCRRLPGFFDWRLPQPRYALGPGLYAISATLLESVYTDPLGPWNSAAEKEYQTARSDFGVYEAAMPDPRRRAALLQRYPEVFWDREYAVLEKLRFGRLCAWLRHNRPPMANVGNSILIWRLNEADLRAALFGPPAEQDDSLLRQLTRRR